MKFSTHTKRSVALIPVLVLVLLGSVGRAQTCDPLPSGSVAWWQADGDVADTRGTNSGILVNGASFSSGQVGQAFDLSGGGYVKVQNSAGLNLGSQFTIEFWFFQRTAEPGGYRLIDKYADGAGGYLFDTYDASTGRRLRFISSPSSGQGNTQYTLNTWHHAAVTCGNGNGTIYLDGGADGTFAFSSPATNTLDLFIGHSQTAGQGYFSGLMDEVTLYSRVLSASEIQAIYSARQAGKCSGPRISGQPNSLSVLPAGGASFAVAVSGSLPLFYQWLFNGTNTLFGQTNATLVLSNVALAQMGNYSVLVSNSVGSVVSSNAFLTVLDTAIPLGDGIPNWWKLRYGLSVSDTTLATNHPAGDRLTYLQKYLYGLNPARIDTDGDNLSDYDEIFIYHTNPTNAYTAGDGIPDDWKVQHGLNPLINDAGSDAGFDGVSYLQVYQYNLAHPTSQLDPRSPFAVGPAMSNYEIINGGQHTNRFYYDREDRLLGMESSRGISIAYTYDGNGNLLRQTVLSRASETNGLPVLWSFLNGLTNNPNPYADSDGDGWSNYQEWLAGTDPNNPNNRPSLLGNPGTNIALLSLPFTPSNFVVGVGQLDGAGAEEIVIGADGNTGTNRNSLLVLTQAASGWSTQRVDVGSFGVTSIAIGQPTNRPNVGIYVGLRGTNGSGQVMEFIGSGVTWQSNVVAFSTNEAAFVAGIRQNGDLLANLATNGMVGALWSLTFSNVIWAMSLTSSNVSHRGIPNHGSVFSRTPRDSSLRLLDSGGIEVIGGGFEYYKDDTQLPSTATYNSAAGKWYFPPTSPLGYFEAQAYFTNYHGNLAVPMSGAENDWISSRFTAESWIGLYWANVPSVGGRPYYANGTAAPVNGNGIYSGYVNWASTQPYFYTLPMYGVLNYYHPVYGPNPGGWGTLAGGTFNAIGEVLDPVLTLTNSWLIPDPAATNRIIWKSFQLKAGRARPGVTNQTRLFHCLVDDQNSSGSVDVGDAFIFAEYQISNNTVMTATLTNIPIGSGSLAQSFGLATADFLNSGADYIFTAEPNGGVYSWSATDASSLLQRHVFTEDYSGKAWHALAGVRMAAGGDGLVGLMVDPTNQSICEVMFWSPQAVISSPQLGVLETAPAAAVIPSSNPLGPIAVVTVRLWDNEGNPATPFLQYQILGSTNWRNATIYALDGVAYNPANRVAALPGGANHVVAWNAMADLGSAVITNVLLRARAQDFRLVGDWSQPTPFLLNMNQDSNSNGIPDWWELKYFGNLLQTANGDYDGDGMSNYAEYIADTDPTDANSNLRIIKIQPVPGGIGLIWQGGVFSTQYLQRGFGLGGTNLWADIFTNLPPTPDPSGFTNYGGTNKTGFYRVRATR
jgi:YD repeat-containing protein